MFLLSGVVSSQELQRYRMYSDHFDVEKYTKQYNRAFDSAGVITQKGEYHALTISLYGIMCYDKFLETGDSSFYEKVQNQYKYFSDTSNFDFAFDGKGVGLPYEFKFHELKPPWYSGLTQGIAVSFLLRYSKLTGDKSALELAQKVNYFMLQPVEDGGTLSKTPEKKLWIEEYPGTRRSKQVLNGFINGLVGLKEYCDFFPEDTMANRIHKEVYASFKSSLPLYDRQNNWTCYDRNGKKISVAYLRIQLTQLEHLYQMYGDDFLRKQMMIWGMMLNSKRDKELKFYLKPEYCFSQMLTWEKENLNYALDFSVLYDSVLVNNESVLLGSSLEDLKEINGQDVFKKSMSIDLPIPQTLIKLKVEQFPKRYEAYILTSEGKQLATMSEEGEDLIIQSDDLFSQVELKSKSLFKKKFQVSSVRYYNYRTLDIPMFGYRKVNYTMSFEKGKKYNIDLESSGATDLTVFYKCAKNEGGLRQSKWFWSDTITDFEEDFEAPGDGCCEFFISYIITNPKSAVGEFIIEEIE